jgi:hypothetical protein
VRRLAGKQKGLPVFRSPASSHSENDKRNELTLFYHMLAPSAERCAILARPSRFWTLGGDSRGESEAK